MDGVYLGAGGFAGMFRGLCFLCLSGVFYVAYFTIIFITCLFLFFWEFLFGGVWVERSFL